MNQKSTVGRVADTTSPAQEQTDAGRALRNVWIKQIKSEIAGEEKFLGIGAVEMTDDDILAELAA